MFSIFFKKAEQNTFEYFFLAIFELASIDNLSNNEKFKTMINSVKNSFAKNKVIFFKIAFFSK